MRLLLAVLLSVLLGLGCTTAVEPDPSTLILHIEYRTGGDAPGVTMLTFFQGGELRLLTRQLKTHWMTLTPGELATIRHEIDRARAASDLSRPSAFGCCDYEEIGVYFSAEGPAVSIPLNVPEADPSEAVIELIAVAEEIALDRFGAKYRRSAIPIPA